jgi:hypothetical protein
MQWSQFVLSARAKVEILNASADRLELETVKAAKNKKLYQKPKHKAQKNIDNQPKVSNLRYYIKKQGNLEPKNVFK